MYVVSCYIGFIYVFCVVSVLISLQAVCYVHDAGYVCIHPFLVDLCMLQKNHLQYLLVLPVSLPLTNLVP